MKFLCDVHISYKIIKHLVSLGFEAIHINEILDGSKTKDQEICKYADLNGFVVITKDSDFRDSFFISRTPKKLIKINLGNISNEELIDIFSDNITAIIKLDTTKPFILEVDKDHITYIKY